MSLIDFIRSYNELPPESDVELEEFDPDSKPDDDADGPSGGRSVGRLVLAGLLLAGVAYVVYRFVSSRDGSFTDIELAEEDADAEGDDEDVTVTVEHDAEGDADDSDAVEVEVESPGDEESAEE